MWNNNNNSNNTSNNVKTMASEYEWKRNTKCNVLHETKACLRNFPFLLFFHIIIEKRKKKGLKFWRQKFHIKGAV